MRWQVQQHDLSIAQQANKKLAIQLIFYKGPIDSAFESKAGFVGPLKDVPRDIHQSQLMELLLKIF